MCRCNTGPWLFSGLLSPLFFTLHLRQDIDATFVKSRLISAKLIARPPLRRQLSRSRMLCRKECTPHAIETGSRYLRHNVRPFVRPRGCGQVETLCVLRVSMRGMARSGRDLATALTCILQRFCQLMLIAARRLYDQLYDPWRFSGCTRSDDTPRLNNRVGPIYKLSISLRL